MFFVYKLKKQQIRKACTGSNNVYLSGMKRFRGILLCLLMAPVWIFAQAPIDTSYIYTYGGKQYEECHQIKATADKGYILFGSTSSFGYGNTSMYAVKIDSACHPQWSKVFGGTRDQAGYSVIQTSDKGYAFAGYTNSFGNGGYDVYLVKTDSLGNTKWQKTYGGSDWDFGYSVKQTGDGGFLLAGQTYSYGSGNGDAYLIRTNKNGDTLWTHTYGGPGYDVANTILNEGDSVYILAGATTSFGKGDTSMLILQLDTNGTVKNTKTLGSSLCNVAYSIVATPDKGYVLIGSMDSLRPGTRSQTVIKTDHSGNFQWMIPPIVPPYQDIGKDIIQSSDGSYLCIGVADGGGYGSSSMLVTHLDSSGGWLAAQSHGGNGDQYGNSVTIGSNGNVLFAGGTNSFGVGNFDFYVVRFRNDSIDVYHPMPVVSYSDTSLPTTGIRNDKLPDIGLKISPNPFESETTFLIQSEQDTDYKLSLTDIYGKCVIGNLAFVRADHGQASAHIIRGSLPAGTYYYEIRDTQKRLAGGKLIAL
jgi:hypothetical protein